MEATWTKSRIQPGKSAKLAKWLQLIETYKDQVYFQWTYGLVEIDSFYRKVIDGTEYVYWFYMEHSYPVYNGQSLSWVNEQHMKYFNECIDHQFELIEYSTVQSFIIDGSEKPKGFES